MNVAFVGCGYVFDIYMRSRWGHPELHICGVFDIDTVRSAVVSRHYGVRVYESYDALLSDERVDIVINLTSIRAHYDTVRQAILAKRHVYSEKPLTLDLSQTKELFRLAQENGVVFTGAPCNLYSDAVSSIWKAVRDGAIGKPVLIYAELDDNPAHLMNLEDVQSPTGAPFPYVEELEEGCTVEHAGYHLAWICAMFGPALSVTAFSSCLIEGKTESALCPANTPDFSVACLEFAGGVVARVTCSWVAPRDHQFRIIGDEGQISADNAFHDQCAVSLERFSKVSLSARKAYSLRSQPHLGRLFGIDGRRIRLLRRWKSHAVEVERGVGVSLKHHFVSWLRRREIYAQDKLLGIAEMARALREKAPQPMPPDFLIHLNELTLLIHRAGAKGVACTPQTTFQPLLPFADVANNSRDYRASYRPQFFERVLGGMISALQRR